MREHLVYAMNFFPLRISFVCLICLVFVNLTRQRSLELESSCDEECICRPPIKSNLIQNIIGYGSLMKSSSVKQTNPLAGELSPVIVKGYRRLISAQGTSVSHSATFMGIEECQNSSFNGVVFSLNRDNNDGGTQQLLADESIRSIDLRESWYCRQKVPTYQIQFLAGQNPTNNEYWIYVNKPEFTAAPNQKYPIVQSYIDLFLGGCIEIEENFKIPGFATDCVKSTGGWNQHYINDRIYPRRATILEPNAHKIDELLATELPNIYNNIQFDG